ncbi:putative helicase MOV-10 [Ciona intestinalis]
MSRYATAECFVMFLTQHSIDKEWHSRAVVEEKFYIFKDENKVKKTSFSSFYQYLIDAKFVTVKRSASGDFIRVLYHQPSKKNEESKAKTKKNETEKRRFVQYINNKDNRKKMIKGPDDIDVICSNQGCTESNTDAGTYACKLFEGETSQNYQMIVRNKGNFSVVLKKCFLLSDRTVISLSDTIGCCNLKADIEVQIPKDGEYPIEVTCSSAEEMLRFSADAIFTFERIDIKRSKFSMLRHLTCSRHNVLMEELAPQSKFERPRRGFRVEDLTNFTYKGTQLTLAGNKLERTLKLGQYKVPDQLRSALRRKVLLRKEDNVVNEQSGQNGDNDSDESMRQTLHSKLTPENYRRKFSILLYLEEMQQTVDRRIYNMTNVSITKTKGGNNFRLKVPGLLERRPSVVVGDSILVKILGPNEKFCDLDANGQPISYQGYVHQVEQEEIVLGFHKKFEQKFVNGMSFAVEFQYNRYPMKLQHRAVEQLLNEEQLNFLFPNYLKSQFHPLKCPNNLRLYNQKLESNRQQVQAINSIVFDQSQVPYIIFGPPGTGKTVTVVEAIKQVISHYTGCHVLVCAPSNSAADLLIERLREHVDVSKLFRMCAQSRPLVEGPGSTKVIPDSIKDVCNYNQANHEFFFPSKKELMEYSVLCTTLTTAGRIASAEFPNNHFDFVFVDEAGYASEPELLISIAGVLKQGGRLIMAGDPKQLGPVIFSHHAKVLGLSQSLLQRLHDSFEIYGKGEENSYDTRFITKLLKNYRNHPDILDEPNRQFYDGELEACADEMERNCLCGWSELPQKNFPIIFRAENGVEEREERSPSYFNRKEAVAVYNYVENLLQARGNGVTPNHIGIISPYKKQCKKIQQLLRKIKGYEKIKIGSVEEFQGQERRVMLISTVRSETDHLVEDLRQQLGFLANPKRMNVAITRAKALLIVVGNPEVLSHDPTWKSFIDFCWSRGGHTGFHFDPSAERKHDPISDIISKLEAFGFNYDDGEDDVSAIMSYVEPRIRHE